MAKVILSIDIDWVENWNQTQELLKKVSPRIKNGEFKNILVSQYHKDMKKLIEDTDEDVFVLNIDHHHDIAYEGSCPLEDVVRSCNWLGYYIKQGKVKGAIWVANRDSNMVNWEACGVSMEALDIHFDLDIVDKFKFDSLFICQSPHYITESEPAFGAWLGLKTVIDLYTNEN